MDLLRMLSNDVISMNMINGKFFAARFARPVQKKLLSIFSGDAPVWLSKILSIIGEWAVGLFFVVSLLWFACTLYYNNGISASVMCTYISLSVQLIDFLVAVCFAKIAELHQKELVIRDCYMIPLISLKP